MLLAMQAVFLPAIEALLEKMISIISPTKDKDDHEKLQVKSWEFS